MNIELMPNVPKKRSDLELHVNLFACHAEQGKVNFALEERSNQERLLQSLLKINTLPNQRVNFLTIDESARLTVNTISNCLNRNFK